MTVAITSNIFDFLLKKNKKMQVRVKLSVKGKDKYSDSFCPESSREVYLAYTCASTSMYAAKEGIKVGANCVKNTLSGFLVKFFFA